MDGSQGGKLKLHRDSSLWERVAGFVGVTLETRESLTQTTPEETAPSAKHCAASPDDRAASIITRLGIGRDSKIAVVLRGCRVSAHESSGTNVLDGSATKNSRKLDGVVTKSMAMLSASGFLVEVLPART